MTDRLIAVSGRYVRWLWRCLMNLIQRIPWPLPVRNAAYRVKEFYERTPINYMPRRWVRKQQHYD